MSAIGMQRTAMATMLHIALVQDGLMGDKEQFGPAMQKLISDWAAELVNADTWPSPEDAAIKACALMIKGICMTHPQNDWPTQIEARIRFMLKGNAPRADADGGKGEAVVGLIKVARDTETRVALLFDSKEAADSYAAPQAEWQFPHLKRCSDASNLPQRYEEDPRDPQRGDETECDPRAECLIDKYSSRVCENGTKSCDVEHPRADAEKDAALTALAGLVHAYVGLCRDSGIDPTMNTQYRNARAILAANKEPT